MEYIEIMSTTEIFEKILHLIDKIKTRDNLNFEVSNLNGVCRIEYINDFYSFFYEYTDNKLKLSIVEVNNGMPSYFGEDLNSTEFRNKLINIYNFLRKTSN